MKSKTPRLLTTRDAADALGVSERQVRKLCIAGRLGVKVGPFYAIPESQLDAFKKIPRPVGRPAKKEGDSR